MVIVVPSVRLPSGCVLGSLGCEVADRLQAFHRPYLTLDMIRESRERRGGFGVDGQRGRVQLVGAPLDGRQGGLQQGQDAGTVVADGGIVRGVDVAV